jgi:hypothetical protein
MTSDHERTPSRQDMLAALAIARAVVPGNGDAHEAAGDCPACTALAAASFGLSVCSTMAGEKLVSERMIAAWLAAVDAAERELRSAGN